MVMVSNSDCYKNSDFLEECKKYNFTAPPCWPSNLLKTRPAYSLMNFRYIQNPRVMFPVIFNKFPHFLESLSSYIFLFANHKYPYKQTRTFLLVNIAYEAINKHGFRAEKVHFQS